MITKLLNEFIISTYSTNGFLTLEINDYYVNDFTVALNYVLKTHQYKITDCYPLSPNLENRTIAVETNIPYSHFKTFGYSI